MSNFITEDVKLAVKKGANWLDENHPDWAQKINLKILNMSDCTRCIIGQAVGSYRQSMATITNTNLYSLESEAWGIENGFNLEWSNHDYKSLEILWTKEVCKRLGG